MNKVTQLTLGVMNTNVYLLETDDGLIVIDPADDAQAIRDAAQKCGKRIEHVLLTHGHFDHCNAAESLQRDGAKIYMSQADYDMINDGLDLARYLGTHFNSFKPDFIIGEGELNLCGLKIDVLSTPGHTRGGLTYVIDDMIFCGDTLFYLSVGRADLPTGDKRTLMQSIKKLYSLDGQYTVYPGHGEMTSLDFERANNPYVKA